MRVDAEGEVAQHLRPKPVAQAYVFESDHAPLRAGSPQISAAGRRNRPESRFISAVAPACSLHPRCRGGQGRRGRQAEGRPQKHGFRFVNGRPLRLPHQPIPTIRPMLITCPDCATSYEVAPSTFGQAGRSVRCTRCRHVWFAVNGGGTEAHPADAAATAGGAEQTRPESWLPAHAADVADAEPPPGAQTVDSALLHPDLPIAGSLQVVPMHPGEAALPTAGVWDASATAPRAGRRSARRQWRLPRPGWPTA